MSENKIPLGLDDDRTPSGLWFHFFYSILWTDPVVSKLSPTNLGYWVKLVSFCNQYETDGFITKDQLKTIGITGKTIGTLEEKNVIIFDENNDGYWVTGFLNMFPSKEERRKKSQKKSEAGVAGAKARWGNEGGDPVAPAIADPVAPAIADPVAPAVEMPKKNMAGAMAIRLDKIDKIDEIRANGEHSGWPLRASGSNHDMTPVNATELSGIDWDVATGETTPENVVEETLVPREKFQLSPNAKEHCVLLGLDETVALWGFRKAHSVPTWVSEQDFIAFIEDEKIQNWIKQQMSPERQAIADASVTSVPPVSNAGVSCSSSCSEDVGTATVTASLSPGESNGGLGSWHPDSELQEQLTEQYGIDYATFESAFKEYLVSCSPQDQQAAASDLDCSFESWLREQAKAIGWWRGEFLPSVGLECVEGLAQWWPKPSHLAIAKSKNLDFNKVLESWITHKVLETGEPLNHPDRAFTSYLNKCKPKVAAA